MSFSINTNLDALNALNSLSSVSDSISTSIHRLSTGLRINSAADDPAGFLIANSLQAQVDGLNQAIANTQEATNLVKTATSGISEISSLLSTIRQNALNAANTGVVDPNAIQANQTAINSAIAAINNIAASTQYGSKKLLDGSAGVSAAVSNSALIGGIVLDGTFAGNITQAGNVTITVASAATRAQVTGTATYTNVNATIATVNGSTTGTGGTVVVNGQAVSVAGSDTVQTLINKINALSATTGVSAAFTSGNGSGSIVLTQQTYGASYNINLSESATLLAGTSGTSVAGQNATVTVVASVLVNGATTTATATFSGGRSGDSGLRVSDTYGNSILLTEAGNTTSTSSAFVAKTSSNALQFQIGGNANQTANLSFNSLSASSLGVTSVAGQSLATIDVTNQTGANNALLIVNEAATQVSKYQAQLGAFQTNVLQTTANYLNNSVANVTASISSIQDTNVAQETINLTNKQIIQQAGISALYRANNLPGLYLSLLSGGR